MAKQSTRNELTPIDGDGFLMQGGPVIITERSFAFTTEATEETALAFAKGFRRMRGISWILGDLLISAEGRFKDVYEQLEAETGFDLQTLANAKSLCKRFPANLRLWDLTPSFYEVVAPCEDAEVKKYLDMAVAKGFVRDDFRDYVREERREANKQSNKAAGVGTGTNAAGAAGIGTGKPAPIKVEQTPKALAAVALDAFTQEERGELASLVLANTTADQVKQKTYDLAIADQYPISMLLFAIERRVAKYDTGADKTAAELSKAVKAAMKTADKFEAEMNAPEPAAKDDADKPAETAGKTPSAGVQPVKGKEAVPAPKPSGKGKGKAKTGDTKPSEPEQGEGDLPVRDLSDEGGGDVSRDYAYASLNELNEWQALGDEAAAAELKSRSVSDDSLEAQYQALDAGGTDHSAAPEGSHSEPDYRNQFGNPDDPELHGGAEVFDDKPLDDKPLDDKPLDGDAPGFPPGVNPEYQTEQPAEAAPER